MGFSFFCNATICWGDEGDGLGGSIQGKKVLGGAKWLFSSVFFDSIFTNELKTIVFIGGLVCVRENFGWWLEQVGDVRSLFSVDLERKNILLVQRLWVFPVRRIDVGTVMKLILWWFRNRLVSTNPIHPSFGVGL